MLWIKELDLFLPQTAHFLLSGNIYDSFLYENNGSSVFLGIKDFLARHLHEKHKCDDLIGSFLVMCTTDTTLCYFDKKKNVGKGKRLSQLRKPSGKHARKHKGHMKSARSGQTGK